MTLEYINPIGLHKSPIFSHGIIIPANTRILIIGGQNGVDDKGQLISKDLGEQSEKAIDNLIKVLMSARSSVDKLIRVGIYIKGDIDIRPGFQAWMKVWGQRPNPPTISVVRVEGFGVSPECLIEIEATAII